MEAHRDWRDYYYEQVLKGNFEVSPQEALGMNMIPAEAAKSQSS